MLELEKEFEKREYVLLLIKKGGVLNNYLNRIFTNHIHTAFEVPSLCNEK